MAGPERFRIYDQFAWYYCQGWGEEFHNKARAVLENHVFPRLAPAARVLDLCCGSGDLTALLQANGFHVTGLDGSEKMLEFARARVPEAEFVLEDARTFHFAGAFDAVISTYDSLNHLLTLAELECVFRNVHAALAGGGLLVFDLNMEDSFETIWHGSDATVEDDYVAVTRGSYDPAEKIGRVRITTFRFEGGWQRCDVTVLERCYAEGEVRATLARAGFVEIEARAARELGMPDSIVGRTFFFAVKPLSVPSPELEPAQQEEAGGNRPAEDHQPNALTLNEPADSEQNESHADRHVPPGEPA